MVLFRSTTLRQLQQSAVKHFLSGFHFWLHHAFYVLRFYDSIRHDDMTWSLRAGVSTANQEQAASRIGEKEENGSDYLFTERGLGSDESTQLMENEKNRTNVVDSRLIVYTTFRWIVSCRCISARWEGAWSKIRSDADDLRVLLFLGCTFERLFLFLACFFSSGVSCVFSEPTQLRSVHKLVF